MNPDPTRTITWDYLLELSDDGMQPDQPESEVIIIPLVRRKKQAPSAAPGKRAQTRIATLALLKGCISNHTDRRIGMS